MVDKNELSVLFKEHSKNSQKMNTYPQKFNNCWREVQLTNEIVTKFPRV